MKKIYILTAVFALLSLSLNAQLLQKYKAQNKQHTTELSKGQAGNSAGLYRAPAQINTADGEFLVGPYTTDDFSTTGKGLYSTTGNGRVEVSTVIPRADIEQYIGQEIVGYRFATVGGTVSCYSFLVESEGPNYYIDDLYYWNIQSDGSYVDLSGNQWHEYYLDEPVVFQIPDTTQSIWIGYKYWQESSSSGSYTMTPIAVNPNVTSYDCYAYSYNSSNQGFYNVTSTLGGAVAAQLIFKQANTTPTLTAPTNGSTVNVGTNSGSGASTTINVSGSNLTENLTVSVSGTGFSVSPTTISAADANAGTTITVTYTGTDANATGSLTISSNEVSSTVNLTASYSNDVIICDGTDENEFLPIYGYWYDSKQINQMIYPESMLANLMGKDITSMTFYSPNLYFSAGKYTVKVGITSQTTFSSPITRLTENSNVVSELKTVAANLVATAGGTKLTITFDEPFNYSGGNLLVDFEVTSTGQYGGSHTIFYGKNQTSATGFYSRGSNTNSYGVYSTSSELQQFLPKVSFTVINSTPIHDLAIALSEPESVVGGETATITATVTNNGNRPETGYTVTITAGGTTILTQTVNETLAPGTSTTFTAQYTTTEAQVGTTVSITANVTCTDDNNATNDNATASLQVTAYVPQTAAPTITVTPDGANYVITATGNGTVTLTIPGYAPVSGEGSASITIPRTNADQTVTATATAQATGELESNPTTQQITIPALPTDPTPDDQIGLLRLHLLFCDQLMANIPEDNSHPDAYGYVLRYEPNGPEGDGIKESGRVKVDIQKTNCEVLSYYTLDQIDLDKNIGINHDQGLTMDVTSAQVKFNLSATNDKLNYYYLQGRPNALPELGKHYLSQLHRQEDFTYREMYTASPEFDQVYENGTHYYFNDTIYTGEYGIANKYYSYAPSVTTWGVQRRYFELDGYDNTYGAPIWKTSVGDVRMDNENITLKAERQSNSNHSVNWTDQNGAAASLYILDGVGAIGRLPHTELTKVEFEPYMFRVFVESKNGKLRPYKVVDADSTNTVQPGEHVAPQDGVLTDADTKGPICVWSGYIKYDRDGNMITGDYAEDGVSFTTGIADNGQTTYIYHKNKVDRANLTDPWEFTKNNAIFGALDDVAIEGYAPNGQPITKDEIDPDDLTVFVRFYFNVKGMAAGHVPMGRAGESARPGNGAEAPGFAPDPSTAVNEVVYNGEIVSRTYVNTLGMQSDEPFEGVNIVVTRYSDGKISTSKVVIR